MRIKELEIELEELIEISRGNLDQLIEREIKIKDLDEKTRGLFQSSIEFKKSTKPWYIKYKYYIGGVSTLTLLSLLFI